MRTRQIEARISKDALLKAVEKLDSEELEELTTQVLTERAKRITPFLSQREEELLETIGRGLSEAVQRRFEDLRKRQETKAWITRSERTELLKLVDQIEKLQVERVQAMCELADVRAVPLEVVLRQLGIETHSHA